MELGKRQNIEKDKVIKEERAMLNGSKIPDSFCAVSEHRGVFACQEPKGTQVKISG